MTGSTARRDRWEPPPRPEWLARMNEEGTHFDLPSVVPLDADSLIATAVRNTGLNDFGDGDGWRERFEILVRSLDIEAQLTLMGRLMTRSDLVITLEARLRVEDTFKRHPEIAEEVISGPLLIVGQGRSGTSFLQSLLAADPNNGTETNWEAQFPCPPPEAATYDTDPRIARANDLTTMWHRVTPEIESMHEFNGRVPTESIHVQCMAFASLSWFDLMGQSPSYTMHMIQQDPADAYRYEKRVLQLLQWRNPRRTWVLKSPVMLLHMPSVLEVFPDAGFVWTQAAGMMAQPIGWLESGALPRERLCNVQYPEFVRDPIGTVARIYEYFGLDFPDQSRAAMQRYLDEHARSDRPAHKYDLGSDAEVQMEREAFRPYQEYFNVADEF